MGPVLEGVLKESAACQGISTWSVTRSSNTAFWRILLEELAGGGGDARVCHMIVLRLIKKLLVGPVHLCVVLACGNLEVRNPSKLTVDVSLLATERRPRRHAGTANSILFIGIECLLWFVRNELLLTRWLVKVLLHKCCESEVFPI